jgi:hypothetical protein
MIVFEALVLHYADKQVVNTNKIQASPEPTSRLSPYYFANYNHSRDTLKFNYCKGLSRAADVACNFKISWLLAITVMLICSLIE